VTKVPPTRVVQAAAGTCGIPPTAKAISANVTAVDATGTGNISLYPGNYPKPVTSTLHFTAGVSRANNAILPLASDGTGRLAAAATVSDSGTVNLLIDVNGYFE